MNFKWIGAVMVLASSALFSVRIAAAHRKSVQTLTQLIRSLDFMECSLQYQLTPLPLLCEQAGHSATGIVRKVYLSFASELRKQTHADVQCAVRQALQYMEELSPREKRWFRLLGASLGRYDLPGQVKGLQGVREECILEMEKMKNNQEERLRSYQTLGLCAGTALVILLL